MVRRLANHKTLGGEEIKIVKLDRSGGCVDRDEKYMQKEREVSIREYFFGNSKSTLSPHTLQMNFDDVTIYKIREGIMHAFISREKSS